jgi:hypothetical protein
MKRAQGINENNEINEKTKIFRYFRLFRNPFSTEIATP